MSSTPEALKDVEVYVFDVFGTVVDWYGNITRQLAAAAPAGVQEGKPQYSWRMPVSAIAPKRRVRVRLGRFCCRVEGGLLQARVSHCVIYEPCDQRSRLYGRQHVAGGGEGTTNMDIAHRQVRVRTELACRDSNNMFYARSSKQCSVQTVGSTLPHTGVMQIDRSSSCPGIRHRVRGRHR